ncbi:MAG: VIT1/CCC1 transporter family protein [Bacteroidota bacterium]|nr:VIT1/CCC1 transporter family protein [Bacteroidota bacterium]
MKENVDTKAWMHHFKEETDAAYLYTELAKRVDDPKKKDIYVKLSKIEGKHLAIWKGLLEKNNIKINNFSPSVKARSLVWLSDKFGISILSSALMREEATEVKDYMSLFTKSKDTETKGIAFDLARDSAEHAGKLMNIKGTASEPWHKSESGGLLRNIVYGFNDGLTANFGLIAGMIGAASQNKVLLITGIAGMIADSLSMGSSGYLAAVSEKEVFENEKMMEQEEIRIMPEVEAEELALIYEAKGMLPDEAKALALERIKNPTQVLEEKLREELGIVESTSSPLKEGWITGTATAIGSFLPILPFIFMSGVPAIVTSFLVSMAAHFGVGAARSFFTGRGIFRSGLDMFVVGFGVAAVGYIIGDLITRLL